jgi:hypothetical protein
MKVKYSYVSCEIISRIKQFREIALTRREPDRKRVEHPMFG